MSDQNTITFSPSDIDQNAQAPVAKAQPTQTSGPITFSPSDIDHDAPVSPTNNGSTNPPQSPNAVATGGAGGTASPAPLGAMGASSAAGQGDVSSGVGQGVGDILNTLNPINIAKGIWHQLPPVELADETKQMLPVVNAYEKARASGASVPDAIKAADITARSQSATIQTLDKVVKAFKDNPTQATARAVTDAGALASSFFVPGAIEGTEGATASEAAVEDPLEVGESSVSPQQTAVNKVLTDSKLPEGGPGLSEEEAARLQSGFQQSSMKNTLNKALNNVANFEDLEPISDSTSVTDAAQELADKFHARSQATFDKVKEITGVDVTALKDKISALDDKITDLAISDPEKAGVLEQQKVAFQNSADEAFQAAKEKGADVTQARSDWNNNLRAGELSKAVRASRGADSTLANPTVDVNKLTPRLQKLSDSLSGGREGSLTQLLGEHATPLVETMEDIRQIHNGISAVSPTGQEALRGIIEQNTGKTFPQTVKQAIGFKPSTNFIGAYKDFNALTPEELAASFPGKNTMIARTFLQKAAAKQVLKLTAMGVAVNELPKFIGGSSISHYLLALLD